MIDDKTEKNRGSKKKKNWEGKIKIVTDRSSKMASWKIWYIPYDCVCFIYLFTPLYITKRLFIIEPGIKKLSFQPTSL